MNARFSRIRTLRDYRHRLCLCRVHTAAAEPERQNDVEEVVVTGTFIRGIAPVGSTVSRHLAQEIQSSGVNDSNQLLGTLVPQSNFFMEITAARRRCSQGVARVPIDRPQLRNVGNPFNNSGSTTLVMMDGHRIVTAGLRAGRRRRWPHPAGHDRAPGDHP